MKNSLQPILYYILSSAIMEEWNHKHYDKTLHSNSFYSSVKHDNLEPADITWYLEHVQLNSSIHRWPSLTDRENKQFKMLQLWANNSVRLNKQTLAPSCWCINSSHPPLVCDSLLAIAIVYWNYWNILLMVHQYVHFSKENSSPFESVN